MLTEEAAMEREAFRERVLKEGMHPCRVPCLDAMAIWQVVHHLTRTYLLTLVDLPEHHSAVTALSETVTLYGMMKLLLREIAAGDHRLAELRFYRHGLRDKLDVESGFYTFGRLRASWLTTSGFDRLTTSGFDPSGTFGRLRASWLTTSGFDGLTTSRFDPSGTFGRLRASWLTTSGFDRLTTSGFDRFTTSGFDPSDTFGRLRASWLTTSGFDGLTTSGLLGVSANRTPLTPAFLGSDRHTEFPHQPLAGIGEREAAYLHDKADDITALAAAETLEDVARSIQMERRVVVVMQRTEATATGLACAVESHAQV